MIMIDKLYVKWTVYFYSRIYWVGIYAVLRPLSTHGRLVRVTIHADSEQKHRDIAICW